MPKSPRVQILVVATAVALWAAPAVAQPRIPADNSFVTLGTMGGPIPDAHRSQPANALIIGRDSYLVDCGDGAADRLGAAGVRLGQLRGIFISHLHWDHTGGLQAILGLRYQTNVPGVLAIYGPPGTRQLVDGLIASMAPAAAAGYGLPGAPHADPAAAVHVVELAGGETVELPGFRVTTAENSHYSFPPGSPESVRFKSLSFRFDLPARSIVYTGDTGPSRAVEQLARNADLLVSEVIDVPATIENIHRDDPGMDLHILQGIVQHLSFHHLTPTQVGELAARAHVRQVVLTHLVPGTINRSARARYAREIGQNFHGAVRIANDLDRF